MQLSRNPGFALKGPQIYELAVRYILLQEVNIYVCCRILFYQCLLKNVARKRQCFNLLTNGLYFPY